MELYFLYFKTTLCLHPGTERMCDLRMYIFFPKLAKMLFRRAECLNCRVEGVGAVFFMLVCLCHSAPPQTVSFLAAVLSARSNGCSEGYGLQESDSAVGNEVGMILVGVLGWLS